MIFLSTLDTLIAQHSLLKHPFYVKWTKGELTMEDMKVYAKEYFHLARSVPGIVERIRVRAMEQRPDMVPFVEENMREEQEHVELWKRFAKSMGISERELLAYRPSALVCEAVGELEALADGTFAEGAVTMYAMELQLPAIASTKKEGLVDFYGLTSEDAHCYFDEHLNEETHLQTWRKVGAPANAGAVAKASMAAQNKVLDAVCEVAGISCHC